MSLNADEVFGHLSKHQLTFASGQAGCTCGEWVSPEPASPRLGHVRHQADAMAESIGRDPFECIDCKDTGTDEFLGLPCTSCGLGAS